jgi:hypothetical protein
MSEVLVETMSVESSTVALLNKSEIDQQIATAHKYPRSIKKFLDEALAMVTLTQTVAEECIYALPRDGKTIEGPSARFAEVVASAWGNSRAGARVVAENGEFVTAQGVFHDLERNVAITYEVQRRITNKRGQKFSADMVGVTANAACSIALRNAILKGVPKAFWSDLYESARQAAIGNVQTLANRRARAISRMQSYGITPDQIFATLGVAGEADVTPEHLLVLHGLFTAIKEGDTTPEEAFAEAAVKTAVVQPKSKSEKKAEDVARQEAAQAPADPAPVDAGQSEMPLDTAAGEVAPPLKAVAPTEQKPVSESIQRVLRTKMSNAAVSEKDVQRKFGVEVSQVTNDLYPLIVEWLKDPTQ